MTQEAPRPTGPDPRPAAEPQSQRRLRGETYALLPTLGEPSRAQREALEGKGFVFITVEPITVDELFPQDPRKVHLHPLSLARDARMPTPFTIAVNSESLVIPGSNQKTAGEQLEMTRDFSKDVIEKEIEGARAIMLPAAALVQLDRGFQEVTDQPSKLRETGIPDYPYKNEGKELISGGSSKYLHVRALEGDVSVGRTKDVYPLTVSSWAIESGSEHIWAAATVVFPRR